MVGVDYIFFFLMGVVFGFSFGALFIICRKTGLI